MPRRSNFRQFSWRFRERLWSVSLSWSSWARVALHFIATPQNSWETWERGCPSDRLILCYISMNGMLEHHEAFNSRPALWSSIVALTIHLGEERQLGPFIREKISRGLHKTRTPRINGTKSMFTAYSTQGQLKPRLILAEGFWDGLIQAAAYLGRESVRINALKRCPRLAEAVNDCCACSVFNYIPDLHGRETRVAVAGKWVLFTFTKWKMADRDSCKKRNVWSAPEEKQILLICSKLEIA